MSTDAGARVARRVGERLLHDAVDVQLLVGREQPFDRHGGEAPAPAGGARRTGATWVRSVSSRPRPRSSAGWYSRTMRASDSVIWRIVRAGRDERRLDRLGHGVRAELERVEQDADGRERLADVVVELAGDALALALDRLQQLRGQALARRLGRLPLGHVARDAEEIDLAVDLEARRCSPRRGRSRRPCAASATRCAASGRARAPRRWRRSAPA